MTDSQVTALMHPLGANSFPAWSVTHYFDTADDEKLANYPGLTKRGGTFYVRKRVPNDLIHVDQRDSVRVSLRTSDRKIAVRRYPHEMVKIEAEFQAHRDRLTAAGTVASALMAGRVSDLDSVGINLLVRHWWDERRRSDQTTMSAHDTDEGEVASEIEYDLAQLGAEPELSESVQAIADRILVEAGAATLRTSGAIQPLLKYPVVERGSGPYKELCALVAQGMRAELLDARNRYQPSVLFKPDPHFAVRVNGFSKEQRAAPGKTIRDLFAAFQAEKKSLSAARDVDKRYGFVLRITEEVIDTRRLASSLDRGDCIAIKNFMQRIPSNASKKYTQGTLTQAAAGAEARGDALLAPNSVRKYMQALLAVLRWGAQNKWGVDVNTADLVGRREARVQRRRFEVAELVTLFDALLPLARSRPDRFWIPALGLLTGARLNEICQLHVEDIVNVDGIWCLNLSLFNEHGVRADDKKLKNTSSERFVPLHPQAVEAGFLTFVRAQSKGVRLFSHLKPGRDGRYSHDTSKWFGRFLTSVGLTQPSLVFHSFRHGFRDACRHVPEITDEVMNALGGWAADGEGARYGNRRMVVVLDRAVKQLQFDGFQLPTTTIHHVA